MSQLNEPPELPATGGGGVCERTVTISSVDTVHLEYVRALEATLNEAYALIEKETIATSGRWHGNETRIRLLERIENLLHK